LIRKDLACYVVRLRIGMGEGVGVQLGAVLLPLLEEGQALGIKGEIEERLPVGELAGGEEAGLVEEDDTVHDEVRRPGAREPEAKVGVLTPPIVGHAGDADLVTEFADGPETGVGLHVVEQAALGG